MKLEALLGRNIFELSGGEKQQIACGSVYTAQPEVYVLDEPSSNLDKKAITRLHETIRRVKESGKTIVISEHRLYFLMDLADRFVYLDDGFIKRSFTPSELGTLSDAAPILWQYGALARLKKGEKIDRLLYDGYSTISLGYAGLWECVYAICGKKLTELEGEALGLDIMKKLNEYTAKWKKAENIDYSIYGTPLESTTYRFAKCLQKRFGIIKGVTDRNYITNSYHVHVTEKIGAFEKLALEAKFQALSPGGAISYVEVPNMQHNIPAVLSVMQFIYDHIMYAELNTKSDYCQKCGWDGEIEIVKDENGKLVWKCPKCGNTDQNTMNVARRTCGYIGSQYWNQGRTQEIKERVLHL